MFNNDEESSEYYGHAKDEGNMKYYVVFLIAIGIYLFLFYRNSIYEGNAATTYFSWALLAMFALASYDISVKHKTPKVIANGDYTTFDGHIERVGDWGVVKRCGIDADFMKLPGGGRHGCIIAPLAAFNSLGPCVAITARVVPMILEALPKEVQDYIVWQRIQEPYLFGVVDSSQYPHTLTDEQVDNLKKEGVIAVKGLYKPSVSFLENKLIDLNKALSEKTRLLDMKTNDMVKQVDAWAGMGERSMLSKARDFAFREDKKD